MTAGRERPAGRVAGGGPTAASRAGPAGWIGARGGPARFALALLAGAALTLGQPPFSQPWVAFLALPLLVWLLDVTPSRGGSSLTKDSRRPRSLVLHCLVRVGMFLAAFGVILGVVSTAFALLRDEPNATLAVGSATGAGISSILLIILDRIHPLKPGAFLTGWAAGFGYFVTGLYWIGHAFLVDPEHFAWMMPFAVALLPAFLGLFWAAAFALARRLWPAGRWWRPLPLAAALTLAEYARGNVLTGFPWGLPGYAWMDTPVMQAAAWVGPYGLTLVTLGLAPLVVLGLAEGRRAAGLAALGLLAALWLGGTARLGAAPAEADGPVLRVVQPNAEQRLKWREEHARRFYERLLAGTAAPADPTLGPPAAVIWPETAVPFLPAHAPERRAEIAEAAGGVPVILGALHGERRAGGDRFMNSVMVIRPDASLGPRYDKHHLVPFGEYLPYPSILGPLGFQKLVPQSGFTPGPGPRVMRVEGLPAFSALICYEMIFPDEVVPAGARPAWLMQVTNDAWFGTWAGPRQHLAQARSRAIEQGLPVVRAANTGISAVIDAKGRVTASMGMHRHGHFDAALPEAGSPTLYARTGDLPAMALVVLGLFLAARRPRGA